MSSFQKVQLTAINSIDIIISKLELCTTGNIDNICFSIYPDKGTITHQIHIVSILAYIYTTIISIILLRHCYMILDQENITNSVIICGKN